MDKDVDIFLRDITLESKIRVTLFSKFRMMPEPRNKGNNKLGIN